MASPTNDIQTAWKSFLGECQDIYILIKDKVKLLPEDLIADEDDWKSIFDELGIHGQDRGIVKKLLRAQKASLPSASSEKLLALILRGFSGCVLRDNRADSPQALLAPNIVGFKIIGREPALKSTFEGMMERALNNSTHSSHNHLVATHASPGGGKSTFLDLLLSRTPEVLMQCPQPLKGWLECSVPLAVTYNSKTNFRPSNPLDSIPHISLACRMLYSYFYTFDSNFDNFMDGMAPHASLLTLGAVMECIRTDAGGKPILLGLDEVVRAFGGSEVTKEVMAVVSAVGQCLNQYPPSIFNAVVTTLNTSVVNAEKTNSGRWIHWVILDRLTSEQSLALFQQELDDPTTRDFHLLLQQVIILCCGHGRTLEFLKKYITRNKVFAASLKFETFLISFCEYMQGGLNLFNLTCELILCALSNEEIDLDANPPSCPKTVREYIRDGFYINNLTGHETKVKPIASLLSLVRFTQLPTSNPFLERLSAHLLPMIQFTRGHWQDFEVFHAHWEALARMFRKQGITSFRNWYPKSLCNTNLQFNVAEKQGGVVLMLNAVPPPPQNLLPTTNLKDVVVLSDYQNNNPGFDVVIFEGTIAVAIECRFSKPDATTTLSLDEVKAKHKLATNAICKHKGTTTDLGLMGITKVVLVVAAYRKSAGFDMAQLPPDTIVLSRDALNNLYSPTLAPILDSIFYTKL